MELLTLYLEANNYNVYKSYNGKEALTVFNDNQIDLVVADVMMSPIDGYELVKIFVSLVMFQLFLYQLKLKITTEFLGLNMVADAYITKPFNPLEVLAYINALLRKSSETKKNKCR